LIATFLLSPERIALYTEPKLPEPFKFSAANPSVDFTSSETDIPTFYSSETGALKCLVNFLTIQKLEREHNTTVMKVATIIAGITTLKERGSLGFFLEHLGKCNSV